MSENDKANPYPYDDKARKVIFPLLKEKSFAALDVGCGRGGTLAWLKAEGFCEKTYGVELNAQAAHVARQRLDSLYEGNIENIDLPLLPNSIDLILCLDVLEHLNDPWTTLKRLHNLIAPGGILIVSVPNVQHFSVVLPLLFKGEWRYADSGLLDRSHVKFFTGRSAREMIEGADFHIEVITDSGLNKWLRLINFITFNVFKPFTVFQYLIRAQKI
jgi:2-polyprenyl-3-methyl-5-hydroxy-6-metoxy-1,4-benzoquinol methylase